MLNNASAAAVQAPPYTSERQRTLATLVVSIALVLEIIDVSIINVAIPVVQRDLLASPRQIEWVVTGYLFFFSILLLTGGRLGDPGAPSPARTTPVTAPGRAATS